MNIEEFKKDLSNYLKQEQTNRLNELDVLSKTPITKAKHLNMKSEILNRQGELHTIKNMLKFLNAQILALDRDLQKNGKDAHGHKKYKRFVIIPLT